MREVRDTIKENEVESTRMKTRKSLYSNCQRRVTTYNKYERPGVGQSQRRAEVKGKQDEQDGQRRCQSPAGADNRSD